MPRLNNRAIAELFREMADLLDIQGGEIYRARAFRRVSHIIENLSEPVEEALSFGRLVARRGVGEGTLLRLKQILRTGTCLDLERLRKKMPSGVRELLQIDGLGPKSVRLIYTHLGVGSVAALEAAVLTGRLAKLPRFGAQKAERILDAIHDYRQRVGGRTPLVDALRVGGELVEAIAALPVVHSVELAGSARRRKATVGDLDVLVSTLEPAAVADHFASLPQVQRVLLRGEGRTSVRLLTGQQADLRVLLPDTFGAGLHYFTGSKRHNIAVRIRGNKRRLKISEHGVFTRADERRLAGGAEVDIFAAIGMPYIPPELREDDGELQAAARGRLPRLVEERELVGDLNVHTLASDGKAPVRAMAEAARALGLRYLAITDHSRSPKGKGLDERGLLAQAARVRELDAEIEGLRLLAGVEVEVLPDGELALDLAVLAGLDWVVAGVHHELGQERREMTQRLVTAMETGVVDCIAHPGNRVLGRREPVELDLGRLLAAARRMQVTVEINSRPYRMDLDDSGCRQARDAGVPLVVSSGAHAPDELAQRRFGVYTARRGWLEARHLLNTRPVEALLLRRAERLRKAAVAAAEPSASSPRDPDLPRQLTSPPLSSRLVQRIESWLRQPDDDAEPTDALAELSQNPVLKAFELLMLSRRRPPARVAPARGAGDDQG